MLEIDDVDTYYGDSQALFGISLKIPAGAVVAMLGRNGMGKTTIIRTIMGLTPPRRGDIRFDDEPLQHLEPNQIARKGIALVPQGRGLFPSLTVKENATIAARHTNRDDAWNLERVYQLFPILHERSNLYGNLLSGGEQQMLAIARALMTNPKVLLMDEPSEGLAPMMVREVSDIIDRLRGTHTVLLAEQNINMALEIADYVYIISKGTVAYEATPQEIRNNHEVMQKYLGV
jgi:branched-chain amino acid transport system ATP-binding protein